MTECSVFAGNYEGHAVAVKRLKCQRISGVVEEFGKEIEMLARIPPHENIVRFFGASLDPVCLDVLCLLMFVGRNVSS